MTVCVCLSQYFCAWGSDEKRWFYDYESHVSSTWAPNSQLLPVLTVAQQRDEIIAQRFLYGTSPVGAVVLFGLCLPDRGAKHSRAFFNDLLLAHEPFIQASVRLKQLLLVKRAIPDISTILSLVRVFPTILPSSEWNLSHFHALDNSQNARECLAPLQLLKRFFWDKNSIHLINWAIFRIRAGKNPIIS